MTKNIRVACLVDYATIPEKDPGFCRHPRVSTTEYDVIRALRELGHHVRVVSVDDDVGEVVRQLTGDRPDAVFNLTEVFRWDRTLDANIAGLLELLDIPFTGNGPAGLMLCRNKALCSHLLGSWGINVPPFAVFAPGERVRAGRSHAFPMVVKPLCSDGSEGISNHSLVRDAGELVKRVGMIHTRFRQPAIAEQFIDGRELYAGILDGRRPRVLPVRELRFGRAGEGGPVMATYQVKWDNSYRRKWKVAFRDARLEPVLSRRVADICRNAFRALQLRDYARIDLRIDTKGKVYVLEVNPNPNLARDDEVALSAKKAGIEYPALIERLLEDALKRKRR